MVIPLDKMFLYYAVLDLASFILSVLLATVVGVGITGVMFDRSFAWLYRIATIFNSLSCLAFIVLLKKDTLPLCRRLAVLIITTRIAYATLIQTSKGTLFAVLLTLVTCMFFVYKRIPAKYVKYGIGIFIFTAVIFYPATMLMRSAAIQIAAFGGGYDINMLVKNLSDINFTERYLSLLQRLGGLDWLLGLMSVGREAFPSYISLQGDAVSLMNTLVPGDIIDASDWISIRHLMPILLRGYNPDIIFSWGGHGENLGIAGMAYVYFGTIIGPLFFLVWSYVTIKVLNSQLSIVLKILYFENFVTDLILGGSMVSAAKTFYEGVLVLIFVGLLVKFSMYKTFVAEPDEYAPTS
jgi:hypothetical protein